MQTGCLVTKRQVTYRVTHCPRHGHELNEHTASVRADGRRECKACGRERSLARRALHGRQISAEARERKQEADRVRSRWRSVHALYVKLLQQKGIVQ